MRRYQVWPPPASTSLIFGVPAKTTIFVPGGTAGSRHQLAKWRGTQSFLKLTHQPRGQ